MKELSHFLKQQDTQESIANFCSNQSIQWKFSPPTGPQHGSVWENAIKACKHHLKRIVGEHKLTFEEMMTVLCQMEACLNSRPLFTPLDANDDDGIAPLTPGHFLIGRPLGLTRPSSYHTRTHFEAMETLPSADSTLLETLVN